MLVQQPQQSQDCDLLFLPDMRKLRYVVYAEDGSFVSQCLDVDVASCGDTEEESVSNLKEALELRFEGEPCDALPASRVVRLGELTLH